MVQNRINGEIQYRLPLDHENFEIILAFSLALRKTCTITGGQQ